MNCALKPRHNESVTWPFSEATCQIIGFVYFRRRSRRMSSDVWSLARPWRRFRRNWGLPGSYCMNGVGRGVAMASSAPSAEGTSASVAELARAKARIEELERLVGRQQLDLDFFRKALRLADALQGPAPARGDTNSSRSSKI